MNVIRNITPFNHEKVTTRSILWEVCKFNYSPILRGENDLPLQSFEICRDKQVIFHRHEEELFELTDWYQEEVQATHFHYLNDDLIIYDYVIYESGLNNKLILNLFNHKTKEIQNIGKDTRDYNELRYTQQNNDKALLFLYKSGNTGIFTLDLNSFEVSFKKSIDINLYSMYNSTALNGLVFSSHKTDYTEEYQIGSSNLNFLDLNTFNLYDEFYKFGGYYNYQKNLYYSIS